MIWKMANENRSCDIYIYICIHPSTAPPSTYMFDRRPETAWGFARGEGFGSFLLVQARTLIPVLNGGFHKWVYPENGWFIMENPSINGWFRGTPILGSLQMDHFPQQTVSSPKGIPDSRIRPLSASCKPSSYRRLDVKYGCIYVKGWMDGQIR